MPSRTKDELEIIESFSRSLKAAIERSGMTQKELSRKLGLSQTTINGWCNARSSMNLASAISIADALGMTVDEVFRHDPEKQVSARSLGRRKSALTEAYSRAGFLLASYGMLSPDARSRVDGAIAVEIAQMQAQEPYRG